MLLIEDAFNEIPVTFSDGGIDGDSGYGGSNLEIMFEHLKAFLYAKNFPFKITTLALGWHYMYTFLHLEPFVLNYFLLHNILNLFSNIFHKWRYSQEPSL